MITKLSHVSLFVLDQDKAYDFYVNKLGFKVHTDAKMENGYRWLTELRRSSGPSLRTSPELRSSFVLVRTLRFPRVRS
jgi:catechol 2,3-dioxygenase-like lactoylglutathione lyase family enzyme